MQYRLAIVEDNANARATLRSHLLPLGIFEVSSFTSGAELRSALRKQHFELILMDYHLGQGRTGTDWILELRQSGALKPSTGLIFITSDRLPQTIGRIIDIHPDILIIKPYTIASLTRHIEHYMTYRGFVSNVLRALDKDDLTAALRLLGRLSNNDIPQRLKSDVLKLHARLLLEFGDIVNAGKMYDSVLMRSEKVLWAQWGKIKCQHAAGQWSQCQDTLGSLLSNNLARERAFEWLASMSFEQQAFAQTAQYLDNIKFSELSVPATRMKSQAFQRQDRTMDAIELLQKKRAMHRSAKDRFNEFTFELAEFYLHIAEQNPSTNRQESLSQARKLIGVAGRSQSDPQTIQKRDYLLAFSAVLENDLDKVKHLLSDEVNERRLERADTPTLVIAAKVHFASGDEARARELMEKAQQRNARSVNISEQVLNHQSLVVNGKRLGLANEQARQLNDRGTQLFLEKRYLHAMQHFYDAFDLSDNTAAFGLNLLQCMIESGSPQYRQFSISKLMDMLSPMPMSDSNRGRLAQLADMVQVHAGVLLPEGLAASSENREDTAVSQDESTG